MELVPGPSRRLPRRKRRLTRAHASRLATLAALAAAALSLPACLTIQPAGLDAPRSSLTSAADDAPQHQPDSPADGHDAIWPARWGDDDNPKGVVVELPGTHDTWRGVRLGRFHDLRPDDVDRQVLARLADNRVGPGGYRFRMEGPGGYIFVPDPAKAGDAARDEHAAVFISGTVAEAPESTPGEPEERVRIQRTWATLYHHATEGDDTRGLVVIAPGLFGVPEPVIGSVVQAFRNAGWSVLRVLSPPSGFTERTTLSMFDLRRVEGSDSEYEVVLDTPAAAFAEISDTRIAEYAYATEALVQWARDRYPILAEAPAALIAMSAGAMSAPAIVARAPDLYGPVAMIAGGGDILKITANSSYTPMVDAVKLDWGFFDDNGSGRPLAESLDASSEHYLKASTLDPLNLTAPLKDRPLLMLQGTNDRAVPSDQGDRLWEALGRPERWLTPLDHGALFLGLWMWTPRLVDWLDTVDNNAERNAEAAQ